MYYPQYHAQPLSELRPFYRRPHSQSFTTTHLVGMNLFASMFQLQSQAPSNYFGMCRWISSFTNRYPLGTYLYSYLCRKYHKRKCYIPVFVHTSLLGNIISSSDNCNTDGLLRCFTAYIHIPQCLICCITSFICMVGGRTRCTCTCAQLTSITLLYHMRTTVRVIVTLASCVLTAILCFNPALMILVLEYLDIPLYCIVPLDYSR